MLKKKVLKKKKKAVDMPIETKITKQLGEIIDAKVKEANESAEKRFEEYKAKFEAEHKELMEKKAGLYNEDVKTNRKEANENIRKAIGAIKNNDFATLKALSEGTDSAGGYTVDTELRAEIMRLTEEYGVSRREMTVLSMNTPSLKLNTLLTNLDVYWTSEMGAKTADDIALSQVTLSLSKLAVIVPMSDEILEDSGVDLVSYIGGLVAERIARKEDLAAFLGDGTVTYGSFDGILPNAGYTVTMTGTTFASMDADDLLDMIDTLPEGAQSGAKFYMHRSIMSLVRKLTDTAGNYIFQDISEAGPATIWGKPVVLTSVLPSASDTAAATSFVLYADLKKSSYVGTRGGLKMDVSNEATIVGADGETTINLWKQDMTGLRFVERWGYVNLLTNAAVALKTAAASA